MKTRTPIDPALRQFLDEQAAAAIPIAGLGDEERVPILRGRMMKALESRTAISGLPNAVEVQDVAITPDLKARLYLPDAPRPLPVLVYLHGGGWVAGSVETHDPFCRLLSQAAGIIILSVDYRRSPEHPHPLAIEDAAQATRWALAEAPKWGGDVTRLALGGDSSGGHLSAVVANQISESVPLAALFLLFPVTDHYSANHPSWIENAAGYGLEAGLMRWYWQQYAQGASPDDPNLSPLRLRKLPAGLPPSLVLTAEYDLLCDEGIAYAEKLKAAGTDVFHLHVPDMHHNFAVHPATVARFPQSIETLDKLAAWLRQTLKTNQAEAATG